MKIYRLIHHAFFPNSSLSHELTESLSNLFYCSHISHPRKVYNLSHSHVPHIPFLHNRSTSRHNQRLVLYTQISTSTSPASNTLLNMTLTLHLLNHSPEKIQQLTHRQGSDTQGMVPSPSSPYFSITLSTTSTPTCPRHGRTFEIVIDCTFSFIMLTPLVLLALCYTYLGCIESANGCSWHVVVINV